MIAQKQSNARMAVHYKSRNFWLSWLSNEISDSFLKQCDSLGVNYKFQTHFSELFHILKIITAPTNRRFFLNILIPLLREVSPFLSAAELIRF